MGGLIFANFTTPIMKECDSLKITKEQKQQNAGKIFEMIHNCKTEDDLERADDMLEEYANAGYIFKKAYKFLSEELDDHISYLVGEGLL